MKRKSRYTTISVISVMILLAVYSVSAYRVEYDPFWGKRSGVCIRFDLSDLAAAGRRAWDQCCSADHASATSCGSAEGVRYTRLNPVRSSAFRRKFIARIASEY